MTERRRKGPGLPPAALGAAYVLLAALPLIAALVAGEGHRLALMRAASAAGVAAGVMILLQMVSSGRFEAISGRIGIDVTMAFHKWAAPAALLLALGHVLLLLGPPDPDRPGRAARRLDWLLTGEGLGTGRLALILLALLVLLALSRDRLPWRYEIWRAGHGLGALALIGLTLAHVLAFARSGLVTGVWLLLALAVAAPALWVYGRRLFRRVADWRVAAIRRVADRLWEVTLDHPDGEALAFRAGQFAWLAFGGARLPLYDHPFSIASAPGASRLRFLIQEAGDFTRGVGGLRPGLRVGLDAPHGSFGLPPGEDGPVLLIAGGVGLAPTLSVLEDLAARAPTRPVRFIYAARAPSALAPAELYAPACARLGLRPILLVDREAEGALGQGPLNEAHLRAALDGLDPARTRALICGPGPMMTSAADMLARLGVPLAQIDYERFSYAVRDMSAKDRRMLAGFAAVGAGLVAMIAAYSLG